jgi:integrase/recombinase XerD
MEKEINKIIDSCNDEFEKQTILILRYTGMHISVLCKADKSYVKENYIQWYRPKTGKLVRIPIHPKIKPFIKKYLSNRKYNYRQYYNRIIREIGDRAGIKGLSPMTFRHTFGVSLLDQGYSLTQVQKMMGVTNLNVITRYTQYSDKQMEEKWKNTGWLK